MRFRKALPLLIALFALVVSLLFVAPKITRAECGVYHTVIAGQNLFRISLRYGVSMIAIATTNRITDLNLIYSGTTLYIPCTSGYGVSIGTPTPIFGTLYPLMTLTPVTLAPMTLTPTILTATPVAGSNCDGFRATSPLDGFTDGSVTFYWDAPRSINVDNYRVIVLNDVGGYTAGYDSVAPVTHVLGNTGLASLGRGNRFSWYVVALDDGKEVCRTFNNPVTRVWIDAAGLSSQP